MAKAKIYHALRYSCTNMDGEWDGSSYCGLSSDSDKEWLASHAHIKPTCKSCLRNIEARRLKMEKKNHG